MSNDKKRKGILKMVYILLIAVIVCLWCIKVPKVEASYSSKFSNYPGYKELLESLQKEYPNWEFEILETGLDWADVIKNETTARHGRNLTNKNTGEWNCKICGNKTYDTGWYCASETTVAYYMDPRNSINEDYIFQFEQLTYDKSTQTIAGVKNIIADCNYLQGNVKYYDKSTKKTVTMNKTYVDIIMEAAAKYNVSPYHIASRIRQEQGPGNISATASGTWSGENNKYGDTYKGLYNYFNIRATGNGSDEVIRNALNHAQTKGWTNPEKAILGGVEFIAKEYISCGQDTLYLQKFDVDDSDDSLYIYQYMQNVSASKSEAEEIREAYRKMGMLNKNSKIKFKIPAFKNMPQNRCPMPGMSQIVTQNVQINKNNVEIKSGKAANTSNIAILKSGDKILRIEVASQKDSTGVFWDKVVLADGRKGYVSRECLTKINDITNANEKYVVSSYTNFRNGPGTENTTIIKLLSPGQILTVIETGKYNGLNGEDWDRVKLSDGTQGYVGTGYIQKYAESNVDRVEVVCKDGLSIRQTPGTSNKILTAVAKGTILTRTQKNVSNANGYTWDKITTSGGIIGYVAREDPKTKQAWIKSIDEIDSGNTSSGNNGNNSNNASNGITGTGIKTSGNNLICQPNITVENIKAVSKDAVIKQGNTAKAKGNVGTGWTVTATGKTYTIVVKGDVTGNGVMDAADLLAIQKHLLGKGKFAKQCYIDAADVTKNGKIDAADLLAIQKHILGKGKITV